MNFEAGPRRGPRRPLISRPKADRSAIAFIVFYLFIIAISVGWLAFLVWAIYSLVTWVTSK